jgi:hypothetical protein
MNGASLEMFDSIHSVLAGRSFPEDQRRDLAMRMSETAESFRRRLERAVRYARMGLRQEAAFEAEAEPTLFELAQHLDSEDLHQWRALCSRQGWPVPDVPDAAALGEIEEAVAQLRPLRKLMARMRLLVLSDAGPWDRLTLLRELAQRDAHNPAWHADIEALEPVAAHWLTEQCESAIQAQQLTAAEQFVEHLEDGLWKAVSPYARAAELRLRLDAAVVQECAARAPAALDQLEAEWTAQNALGVEEQLSRWRRLESRAGTHGGALPDALIERAVAVESWLEDRRAETQAQQEHQDRAAHLEDVLATEAATLAQLRRALSACEDTSEGCPEQLRRRARDEIAALERRQNGKRALAVVGVVVVAAAVVAVVWYGVAQTTLSQRVEGFASAISARVAAGDLDEASRILAEADQDFEISGDERITAARREYMNARSTIARGDREFDGLMAAAGDPDSPDASIANVQQAGQLARTEAQHKAVSEWLRLHKRAGQARAAALAQEQLKEVRAIAQLIAAQHADPESPTTIAALAECDSRLGALARAAQDNSAVMTEVQRAQLLLASQRTAMQGVQVARGRTAAVRALAAHVADPAALLIALERFAADHPESQEALALGQAITSAPLWQGVAAWNSVVQGRTLAKAATMTQQERDVLLSALRNYASANAALPMSAPARSFATLLVPADGWRLWLEDKLANLSALAYFQVELKDGTRYYTLQDPARTTIQSEPGGKTYRILSVLTSGGVDPKTAFQRVDESAIKTMGPSPQSVLAAQLRDMLEDADSRPELANGVQAALTTLARVRDAEAVDSALAALLARGILESLLPELPAAIQAPMQAAAKRIAREKPENIDWVSGSALGRDRARALRSLLVDTLKVEQWRKAYTEAIAAAAVPLQVSYAPAALLLDAPAPESGRVLVAADARPIPPNTSLTALKVGVGNQPSTMVQVGATDSQGTVTLTAEAKLLPVGTLVFSKGGGAP